jgi:hypothetical protein
VCSCEYATLTISEKQQKPSRSKEWLQNAEEKMESTENQTSAPPLKPFDNWYTGGLLVIILILVSTGIVLLVAGSFIGVIMSTIGATMWFVGKKKIDNKPRTGGIVHLWGSPVHSNNGTSAVVVGGDTILADYFPFYISIVPIEMTNADKSFAMSVISKNKVPLQGEISITLRPKKDDAIDYLQAGGGKMDPIFDQLKDIVYRESQKLARDLTDMQISTEGEKISDPLEKEVKKRLDGGSFGVEIIKVQARFELPKEILNAMQGLVIEGHQRTNEQAEYRTDMEAAEQLRAKFIADSSPGTQVPSLEMCLSYIKDLRLIRDERYVKIDTAGGKAPVVLSDLKLNLGGKEPKEKKGGK